MKLVLFIIFIFQVSCVSQFANFVVGASGNIFSEEASLKFFDLQNEYVSLLNLTRKISQQSYGDFYTPLGSPYVIGSLLPPKSKIVLALSVMLGGVLAIIVAFALPSSRK